MKHSKLTITPTTTTTPMNPTQTLNHSIHDENNNKETAGLWEITGWKQLYGHAGHEITSLVINRNNSLIASGDNQGYVCLWDRYRLTLIKTINTNIINDHDYQQNEFGDSSNSSQSHSITTTTTNTGQDYHSIHDLKQPRRRYSSNHLTVENSIHKSNEDIQMKKKKSILSSSSSSSSTSTADFININDDSVLLNNFKRIDGICFNLTSGELVVAKWNHPNFNGN